MRVNGRSPSHREIPSRRVPEGQSIRDVELFGRRAAPRRPRVATAAETACRTSNSAATVDTAAIDKQWRDPHQFRRSGLRDLNLNACFGDPFENGFDDNRSAAGNPLLCPVLRFLIQHRSATTKRLASRHSKVGFEQPAARGVRMQFNDSLQLCDRRNGYGTGKTDVPFPLECQAKRAAVHQANDIQRRRRALPAERPPQRIYRISPAPRNEFDSRRCIQISRFVHEVWRNEAQFSQRREVTLIDPTWRDDEIVRSNNRQPDPEQFGSFRSPHGLSQLCSFVTFGGRNPSDRAGQFVFEIEVAKKDAGHAGIVASRRRTSGKLERRFRFVAFRATSLHTYA